MRPARATSKRMIWKVGLRRHDDVDFRYVQTQRHARPPKIGETFMVRNLDDARVRSVVRSVRKETRQHGTETYAVEVEEIRAT